MQLGELGVFDVVGEMSSPGVSRAGPVKFEFRWPDVLRSGDVTVAGPTRLRRSFATWNRHHL
jgi:hypothetical protein